MLSLLITGMYASLSPMVIDNLLSQVILYLSAIYLLTFIIALLLFLMIDYIIKYINKHFYLNISPAKWLETTLYPS